MEKNWKFAKKNWKFGNGNSEDCKLYIDNWIVDSPQVDFYLDKLVKYANFQFTNINLDSMSIKGRLDFFLLPRSHFWV